MTDIENLELKNKIVKNNTDVIQDPLETNNIQSFSTLYNSNDKNRTWFKSPFRVQFWFTLICTVMGVFWIAGFVKFFGDLILFYIPAFFFNVLIFGSLFTLIFLSSLIAKEYAAEFADIILNKKRNKI